MFPLDSQTTETLGLIIVVCAWIGVALYALDTGTGCMVRLITGLKRFVALRIVASLRRLYDRPLLLEILRATNTALDRVAAQDLGAEPQVTNTDEES